MLLGKYEVAFVADKCGVRDEEAECYLVILYLVACISMYIGIVSVLTLALVMAAEILAPEFGFQQVPRQGLHKYLGSSSHEVHVHLLCDEDFPRHDNLVVQSAAPSLPPG